MQISNRLSKLKPSATIAMTQMARELKEQGKDIISLSIGEPDFNTPDFLKEKAIQAIKENYSHYPPLSGFNDLKIAICEKFKRDNNIIYKPSEIVVSTGAKQCLYNVIQAIVNEGDEVIIPCPYWVTYRDIVQLSGGIPIFLHSNLESDFDLSIEDLRKAITNKTKAIIYSSPCNPSGSMYSVEKLKQITNVLSDFPNVIVISDEIYEYITYGEIQHTSIASFGEMRERTVTINGLAKSYAMTGYRIGYMGAPQWIAKACEKLQGQVTSGANSVAQRAAIAAVQATKKDLQFMIDEFKQRQQLAINLLKEIVGIKINKPAGTFYLFPNVEAFFGKSLGEEKINNSNDLALYLLKNANVATVAGSAFGMEGHIRISYATSRDLLTQALKRIKSALEVLA